MSRKTTGQIAEHMSEQMGSSGSALADGHSWQKISELSLRLADTVTTHPVQARGQTSYILNNALDNRQIRVDAYTHGFLCKLDGTRTLGEISKSLQSKGKQPESLDALAQVILQLHEAGMLLSSNPMPIDALLRQRRRQQRRQRYLYWIRLLSPRFSLWKPDLFLQRTLHWLDPLRHPVARIAWLALIVAAVFLAGMQWESLTLYGAQHLDQTSNWLVLLLLYPVIKGLHELAHGYASKAVGARVGGMGVTLLVFIPVPFVDASDSSLLPDKRQRMLVASAGILMELTIAALALFLWWNLEDGLMRDTAFAAMLIGGVSTLLFNGNPLLRFDGYYVLSDAIEIPNLATRSARYYAYLSKRYLLGTKLPRPDTAKGETRWLLGYGFASTVYRLAIGIGVAIFLLNTLPVIGFFMAAWLLTLQLLLPIVGWAKHLLHDPSLEGRRWIAISRVMGLTGLILATLAFLPVPQRTMTDGIVQLPEHSVIRAESGGFLQQVHITDGDPVTPGTRLFTLENQELQAETRRLSARVRELQMRRDALPITQRVDLRIESERLEEAKIDLAESRERLQALQITSPDSGVVHLALHPETIGTWIAQGELLAYFDTREQAKVMIATTEAEAERLRQGIQQIQLMPSAVGSRPATAKLERELPAGTDTLSNAAFGSRGGGRILVDSRDEHGLKTLQNTYAFELSTPATQATKYVGRRMQVLIEHPSRPLFPTLYETARRFVLDQVGE